MEGTWGLGKAEGRSTPRDKGEGTPVCEASAMKTTRTRKERRSRAAERKDGKQNKHKPQKNKSRLAADVNVLLVLSFERGSVCSARRLTLTEL